MEQPSLVAQSIERIRAYRAHRGWTLNRMAREAGLRESSIRSMDLESWNPETRTLRQLESIIPAHFDPSKPDGGLGEQQPEAKPGEAA